MYAPVTGVDAASYTSAMRVQRLNKEKNNWLLGMIMDLIFGAGPWVLGVVIASAGITAIYVEVAGAKDTFALFNAPTAINAISTFAAFLLVGKQGTNLSNNNAIIGQFGKLSGSLVNICLFMKSQMATGKVVDFLTLPDGQGGFFQTTRVGLVCASIMYVVKYTGRGTAIKPEGLPLGQDARLLASYNKYIAPANGSPGMSPFMACILMIGEIVDEFQAGEKPSEYAVLFTQLNAVTAAEGTIGGTTGYSGPYAKPKTSLPPMHRRGILKLTPTAMPHSLASQVSDEIPALHSLLALPPPPPDY